MYHVLSIIRHLQDHRHNRTRHSAPHLLIWAHRLHHYWSWLPDSGRKWWQSISWAQDCWGNRIKNCVNAILLYSISFSDAFQCWPHLQGICPTLTPCPTPQDPPWRWLCWYWRPWQAYCIGTSTFVSASLPLCPCWSWLQLQKGANDARSDDVRRIKEEVGDWLNADFTPTVPFLRKSRAGRGLQNDICGRLLCPIDHNWDDER